jgi:hypothetical protein
MTIRTVGSPGIHADFGCCAPFARVAIFESVVRP